MSRAPLLLALAMAAAPSLAQDAGALRARHAALQEKLAGNGFGRPLHVESTAEGGEHKGDIYAVVEHPFGEVARSLARPRHWCDILTLQVNVKYCAAAASGPGGALTAVITRKARDALQSGHQVDFAFEARASDEDYLEAALRAAEGPVGTRDYHIALQAAPLGPGRTFLHFSYRYGLGAMARMAMDLYLATSGRDKVGFSVVDERPVDGVRGMIERSAMRHYLAIEAFLDSLDAPEGGRLEARLLGWYGAISRHPQLREEVGRGEYVEMKLKEAAG
jgi:hypothetical protein